MPFCGNSPHAPAYNAIVPAVLPPPSPASVGTALISAAMPPLRAILTARTVLQVATVPCAAMTPTPMQPNSVREGASFDSLLRDRDCFE